jgi:hypothetical protein
MTTRQVLDEVKALDPKERAKVLDLLLEIEAEQKITYMEDKSFDHAAERVVDRHAELMKKLAQ